MRKWTALLAGASHNGAKLGEVSLVGSNLDAVTLAHAILYSSKLDGVSMRGATLDYASIGQVSLTGANLFMASLKLIDWREITSLRGANIADVRGLTEELRRWALDTMGALEDTSQSAWAPPPSPSRGPYCFALFNLPRRD